jgi:hypothetical protein
MKNWFGLESHPSDDLIHWSQVSDKKEFKEFKEEVRQLRAAWDLLVTTPARKKALELLMDAKYNKVSSDHAEDNNEGW